MTELCAIYIYIYKPLEVVLANAMEKILTFGPLNLLHFQFLV